MTRSQENHQGAEHLPEGVRPAEGQIGDVAVNDMVGVGEEHPARHRRKVKLCATPENECASQADSGQDQQR